MSNNRSLTIIPGNAYNVLDVHTGNYLGANLDYPLTPPSDFSSYKFKGDGWYGETDGLHTVLFVPNNVDGFKGIFKMQASLSTTPTEDDWTDIPNVSIGDGIVTLTDPSTFNFTGNYVWVRAVITQFTFGGIIKVQYAH